MNIHLDFESRSEVDIIKTGAWIYSTHPSTDIQCTAYAIDDGPLQLVPHNELPTDLIEFAKDPQVLFNAHNAFFEQCIWKNILVNRYEFPKIPINRWRCTAAKAAAYALPRSLEKAAQAIGLPVQKDKKGYQTMLRMCKPLPNKKGLVMYDEDPEHYEMLYQYCKQDVEVERGIDNLLPDLSETEQQIWFYDQLINTRGVLVDMETVHKCIEILNRKTNELNKELSLITEGRITKGTQTVSMVKYLQDEGVAIDSVNKESVSVALKAGLLKPKHIRILRLRQQLGKSSLAKYQRLVDATDENNTLRESFLYHGSSTGRWVGRQVQLQNLPRGTVDSNKAIDDILTYGYPATEFIYPGKIMDTLSACIRGMFVPPKGHELYVADYGAIEARVLMWLSGETLGLKEFQATDAGTDEDIYVKMAQRIYNNPTLTKKNNKAERALGKQAILGSGYGMAHIKFAATCAGYGIDISETEAKRIIDLYRSTYFHVCNYWYDIESAMRQAFENPEKIIRHLTIAFVYRLSRKAIFCCLPSGRLLTYHQPELHPNKFGRLGLTFMTVAGSNWVRHDVFGGSLVENISQAVARDIIAYSIPRLERAGFPVLMHVHDEIVSHRPIGEEKISEMIELMCTLPHWAKGCPIVAEGFTSLRYKKG